MGILTDSKIKEEIKNGNIYISDFDEQRLNSNSYNLRLDKKLLVYNDYVLDMKEKLETSEIIIPEEGLILEPNKIYLATTIEYTETLNTVCAILDGRSSIGRLGICVHVTAGFIDTGFKGKITLEITVSQPIRIYPNIELCQIYYLLNIGECLHPYNGKYFGQTDVTPSRIFNEFSDKGKYKGQIGATSSRLFKDF